MSQELTQFMYADHPFRVVEDGGEVWFVAADVARALGYREAYHMTRKLNEDEKGPRVVGTLGGAQTVTVITEAGFYHALNNRQTGQIVDSQTRQVVERFQRWVNHEVLPSIKSTGSYSIEQAQPVNPYAEMLPRNFSEALRQLARQVDQNELLQSEVRELTPKADSFDEFMAAEGTEGVGNVGKIFDIGEVKFFEKLREGGIFISKGAMRNTPYQKYMHHFAVKAKAIKHRDGSTSMAHTTYVKPSGVDFIGRKLGLTRVSEQLELFEGGDAA